MIDDYDTLSLKAQLKMSLTLHLPEQFTHLPRYPLLYTSPSPIHPLQALTTQLNPSNTSKISLYAKREDHSSPLACAGNKYRKLEYIIPDILSSKPPITTLVTEGAVQSNHTVQVAAVARKLGLKSLVLLGKNTGGGLAAASDQEAFLRTGNVQVAKLLGAHVRLLDAADVARLTAKSDQYDTPHLVMEELRKEGSVPYWIPSGASLHPLGGVGYARCAVEIAMQEEELRLPGSGRFDYVFVACGSGSTVGGLIAGFKLVEKLEKAQRGSEMRPRRVIGIPISPTKPLEWHQTRVLDFARRAAGLIGLDSTDVTMDDVRLDGRFAGSRYGVLDTETKQTLEMMAREEGVVLDPVYTAKVLRGMMHYVQHGELDSDPAPHVNALFIHTGGQAALAAYADID